MTYSSLNVFFAWQVDCWALGVLLYALVYGSMPFDGASHAMLTEQISQGRYRRPDPPSGTLSLLIYDSFLSTKVENTIVDEGIQFIYYE